MCPGLVVMGNDSRSEWMDIFLHIFVVKSNVCLKRPKINEKESGVGPFFKITSLQLATNQLRVKFSYHKSNNYLVTVDTCLRIMFLGNSVSHLQL